jgi:hypothetical protein
VSDISGATVVVTDANIANVRVAPIPMVRGSDFVAGKDVVGIEIELIWPRAALTGGTT